MQSDYHVIDKIASWNIFNNDNIKNCYKSIKKMSFKQIWYITGDFKPASVDVNKMATVDVGTNNQVTVTVPHLGKLLTLRLTPRT